MDGIYFPGLHIYLKNVLKYLTLFGKFKIPLYAIIITAGFLLALFSATREAKRTKQDPEVYFDFFLVLVIPAILGARIYYVLFNLDRFVQTGKSFGQTVFDMINIRNGGLAIYGGLILGTFTAFVFCKKQKVYLPLIGDTVAMGVLIGQILGRWGNFFNRECFGDYYKGIFRMAIPISHFDGTFLNSLIDDGIITEKMLQSQEFVNGVQCITVHPTFIYESLWNLLVLIVIFLYRKRKNFDGELAMIYVFSYGVGRLIVEQLRTDSLMIGPLKISQVIAVLCIVIALLVINKNYLDIHNGKKPKLNYVPAGNAYAGKSEGASGNIEEESEDEEGSDDIEEESEDEEGSDDIEEESEDEDESDDLDEEAGDEDLDSDDDDDDIDETEDEDTDFLKKRKALENMKNRKNS